MKKELNRLALVLAWTLGATEAHAIVEHHEATAGKLEASPINTRHAPAVDGRRVIEAGSRYRSN